MQNCYKVNIRHEATKSMPASTTELLMVGETEDEVRENFKQAGFVNATIESIKEDGVW